MDEIELEQLYVMAARRLKVTQINEPLSAEDRQAIADLWPGVYAMLEGRGLALFPDDGPIGARYYLQVRDLLAEQAAGEFGKEFAAPWALVELSRQVAPDYTYDETVFVEF